MLYRSFAPCFILIILREEGMKYIMLVIMVFAPFTLDAAGTVDVTTTIESVSVVTDEYAIINMSDPVSGLPSCAESQPKLVSFNITTPQGTAFLSLALSAIHTKSTLKFTINDTSCGVWGTRALLARLVIYAD